VQTNPTSEANLCHRELCKFHTVSDPDVQDSFDHMNIFCAPGKPCPDELLCRTNALEDHAKRFFITYVCQISGGCDASVTILIRRAAVSTALRGTASKPKRSKLWSCKHLRGLLC
jgi:hypothetical protein